MLIVESTGAEPEHALSSDPAAHVALAPGNRGACVAAIPVVTGSPLIVVGAFAVHDHTKGQLAVALPVAQLPVSTTLVAVAGDRAFQLRETIGFSGV
jgi:hypothetical protein